jgi:hypothetical protein
MVTTPAPQRTVIIKHPGLKSLEGGFTSVPTKILRNADLSTGARLTYTLLLSYAWQEDFCFPAQDKLATDLGLTDRHVRRHLTELREKGYITWKQQGLNRPNIYYILEIEPAKPSTPTPHKGNPNKNTEWTPVSGPDRTQVSGLERTQVSDYKYSKKNTQDVNVNVPKIEDEDDGGEPRYGARSAESIADILKSTTGRYHPGHPDPPTDSDHLAAYETKKQDWLVADILKVTGDRHSRNFYRQLARTLPEGIISMALTDTRDAKAAGRIQKTPGAYFTDAVKQLAQLRGIPLDFKARPRP